jgi:hypothetical protein
MNTVLIQLKARDDVVWEISAPSSGSQESKVFPREGLSVFTMAPPTDSSRMGSNQSEENSSQVVRKGSSFLSHRLQPPGLK